MADVAVRSGAAGAGTGADWTNAYTSLAAAQTGGAFSASNTIWLADDHAESTSTTTTFAFPSSHGCRVLGANDHTTWPPTTVIGTPSATITKTTTAVMTYTGCAYIEGIIFIGGSGTSSNTQNWGNSSDYSLHLKNCYLQIGGTGTAGRIGLGASIGSSNNGGRLRLTDCKFKFANANQSAVLRHGRIEIINLSIDATGTTPTDIFITATDGCGFAAVEACDFSNVASNVVDPSAAIAYDLILSQIKHNSGASLISASPTIGGCRVRAFNCDSGNTNYERAEYDGVGHLIQETTIVRTSGASDGTTSLSWKIVSDAAAFPGGAFYSPWIAQWNDSIGSSLTATLEYLHDTNVSSGQGSGTNSAYRNDEAWIEVVYFASSTSPQGALASSRVSVMGTPADNSTGVGTGSWTTTGMTTPKSGKASVSFTPQQKGYVRARLCFAAAANKQLYICPKLSIA